MKLKELYKKYKGYDIVVFGRPLEEKTIPFTKLPKDKDLMECEVIEIEIVEKEFEQPVFSFSNLKLKKIEKMKGHVYVYVK